MTKIAAVDEASEIRPDLPPDLPPDLTYSDDHDPGIRRQERRGGWTYLGPDGETVTNEKTLKRIKALAIPPAWEDVWISPDASGHIQATGRDARRRKQ